jgi:hypothetical protein
MGDKRGQRHTAAEALGKGHDVGRYTGMLVAEDPTGAADPGLDLVEDQQHAALVAQRA